MTRDDQRAVWAIALAKHAVQTLELKVLGYLSTLLESSLAQELPRPLLRALRTMNREHCQVLRRLQGRLTDSLLADLPASVIPTGLLRLRAQLDFGM